MYTQVVLPGIRTNNGLSRSTKSQGRKNADFKDWKEATDANKSIRKPKDSSLVRGPPPTSSVPRTGPSPRAKKSGKGKPLVAIPFVGGPGVGIDTQIERLVKAFNFHHVCVSALVRSYTSGRAFQAHQAFNGDPPADVIAQLILDYIRLAATSGARHFLINGFFKSLGELYAWKKVIEPFVTTPLVIFMEAPENVRQARLQERFRTYGHGDDSSSNISDRFRDFDANTAVVIHLLKQKGNLCEISAEPTIDKVYDGIQQTIISLNVQGLKCLEDFASTKGTVVILMGGPGSGSHEQAKRIAALYAIVHLDLEVLLLEEGTSNTGSDTGELVRKCLDAAVAAAQTEAPSGRTASKLPPKLLRLRGLDQVSVAVRFQILLRSIKDQMSHGERYFLLTGFPGNMEELNLFKSLMTIHVTLEMAILLDAPEDVRRERLKTRSSRARVTFDDQRTEARLRRYLLETVPVLEELTHQRKLRTVAASSDDAGRVFDSVCAELQNIRNLMAAQRFRLQPITPLEMTHCVPLQKEKAFAVFLAGRPGLDLRILSSRLADDFAFTVLTVQDLLLEAANGTTSMNEFGKAQLYQGQLVPDQITVSLIRDEISKHLKFGQCHFLIVGFPQSELAVRQWQLQISMMVRTVQILFIQFDRDQGTNEWVEEVGYAGPKVDEEFQRKQNLLFYRASESFQSELVNTQGGASIPTAGRSFQAVYEDCERALYGLHQVRYSYQSALELREQRITTPTIILTISENECDETNLATAITQEYAFEHLQLNQLIDEESNRDTESGHAIRSCKSNGSDIPAPSILHVLTEAIKKSVAGGKAHFLLTGTNALKGGSTAVQALAQNKNTLFPLILFVDYPQAFHQAQAKDISSSLAGHFFELVGYLQGIQKCRMQLVSAEASVDALSVEIEMALSDFSWLKFSSVDATAFPPPTLHLRKRNEQSEAKVVVCIGGPGSGMDEYIRYILFNHNFGLLSAEILISEEDPTSAFGEMIAECRNLGKPIPDRLLLQLVREAVTCLTKRGCSQILLTGLPITSTFWREVRKSPEMLKIDKCLLFDCPEEICRRRLIGPTAVSSQDSEELQQYVQRILERYQMELLDSMPELSKLSDITTITMASTVGHVYDAVDRALQLRPRSAIHGVNLSTKETGVHEPAVVDQFSSLQSTQFVNLIVLLGRPGVDLRWFVQRLEEDYELACVSPAEIIRRDRTQSSTNSEKVYALPKIVQSVTQHSEGGRKTVIIDGYPMDIQTWQAFAAALAAAAKLPVRPLSILVDCPPELLLRTAMSKSTSPTQVDALRRRLYLFEQHTVPLASELGRVGAVARVLVQDSNSYEVVYGHMQAFLSEAGSLHPAPAEGSQSFGESVFIFVDGCPGAGKTALCQEFVRKFDFVHLQMNKLFESEVSAQTLHGKVVTEARYQGIPVPGPTSLEIVRRHIAKHVQNGRRHFMIENFLQNVSCLSAWRQGMELNHNAKITAIWLTVPEQVGMSRLLSKFPREVIAYRYEQFNLHGRPVLESLASTGRVMQLAAQASTVDVYQNVMRGLVQLVPTIKQLERNAVTNQGSVQGTERRQHLIPPAREIDVSPNHSCGSQGSEIASLALGHRLSYKSIVLVLVLGRPGAGKTTQCQLLAKHHDFVHVDVNDLCKGDGWQSQAKNRLAAILDAVQRAMDGGATKIALEGYPDTIQEWSDIRVAFGESTYSDQSFIQAIILDCPHVVAMERLFSRTPEEATADGRTASIETRISTFSQETSVVVDEICSKCDVYTFSSAVSAENLWTQIQSKFGRTLLKRDPATLTETLQDSQVIFMFGPPGSDRERICQDLVKEFGLIYIDVHALCAASTELRTHLSGSRELLAYLQSEMNAYIKQVSSAPVNFLISGFPRTEEDWKAWTKAQATLPSTWGGVYLKVARHLCILQLKKETVPPEVGEKLVDEYQRLTVPLLNLLVNEDQASQARSTQSLAALSVHVVEKTSSSVAATNKVIRLLRNDFSHPKDSTALETLPYSGTGQSRLLVVFIIGEHTDRQASKISSHLNEWHQISCAQSSAGIKVIQQSIHRILHEEEAQTPTLHKFIVCGYPSSTAEWWEWKRAMNQYHASTTYLTLFLNCTSWAPPLSEANAVTVSSEERLMQKEIEEHFRMIEIRANAIRQRSDGSTDNDSSIMQQTFSKATISDTTFKTATQCYFILVLGGTSAGGKTQAEMICKYYSFTHISIEQLLRGHDSHDTNKIVEMVDQAIMSHVRSGAFYFIVSGFHACREVITWEVWQQVFDRGHVVGLELKCSPEVRVSRLEAVGESTASASRKAKMGDPSVAILVEKLRARKNLREVDAEQFPVAVYDEIKVVMDSLFKSLGLGATTPEIHVLFIIGGPGAGCVLFGDHIQSCYHVHHINLAVELAKIGFVKYPYPPEWDKSPRPSAEQATSALRNALMLGVEKGHSSFVVTNFFTDINQFTLWNKTMGPAARPASVIVLTCPDVIRISRLENGAPRIAHYRIIGEPVERVLLKEANESNGRAGALVVDTEDVQSVGEKIDSFLDSFFPEKVHSMVPTTHPLVTGNAYMRPRRRGQAEIHLLRAENTVIESNGSPVSDGTVQLLKTCTVTFLGGPPGSGVKTQAKNLCGIYEFQHLHIQTGTSIKDLHSIIQTHIEAKQGRNNFLITGFPRSVDQLEIFQKEVPQADFKIFPVLECIKSIRQQRLLECGRTMPEILTLFADFDKDTRLMINEMLRLGKGKLNLVSSHQPIELTTHSLCEVLDPQFGFLRKQISLGSGVVTPSDGGTVKMIEVEGKVVYLGAQDLKHTETKGDTTAGFFRVRSRILFISNRTC